jgi:hypothetical protein
VIGIEVILVVPSVFLVDPNALSAPYTGFNMLDGNSQSNPLGKLCLNVGSHIIVAVQNTSILRLGLVRLDLGLHLSEDFLLEWATEPQLLALRMQSTQPVLGILQSLRCDLPRDDLLLGLRFRRDQLLILSGICILRVASVPASEPLTSCRRGSSRWPLLGAPGGEKRDISLVVRASHC